jgi:hypothetical protein
MSATFSYCQTKTIIEHAGSGAWAGTIACAEHVQIKIPGFASIDQGQTQVDVLQFGQHEQWLNVRDQSVTQIEALQVCQCSEWLDVNDRSAAQVEAPQVGQCGQ